MNIPPVLPSFSGRIDTVILSPGLTEFFDHPRRPRKFGLIPSIAQLSTTPLSLVTSTQMNVWGFVQSKRLTTPVIVCSFDVSNAANE